MTKVITVIITIVILKKTVAKTITFTRTITKNNNITSTMSYLVAVSGRLSISTNRVRPTLLSNMLRKEN